MLESGETTKKKYRRPYADTVSNEDFPNTQWTVSHYTTPHLVTCVDKHGKCKYK
jgi:hypothetical protein